MNMSMSMTRMNIGYPTRTNQTIPFGVPPRQRGFSLVEALVGIGIFAVGMLGVAMLTVRGMHDTTTSRVYPAAMALLTQKVEPLNNAAKIGIQPFLDVLPTLTASADPNAVGDSLAKSLGITLTSATDGKGVVMTGLDPKNDAAKIQLLRPPYVLVITMNYNNENKGVTTLSPVTRVFVRW